MPIAGYLESGILSWAIMLAVLVVIGIWWAWYALRHPKDF